MNSALREALDEHKKANGLVSVATAALLKSSAKLGSAILEDSRTLLAKIPGNLFDYSKAQAYAGSVRQVESVFNSIEEFTGRSFPIAQQRAINFFADFMGSSPKDTAMLLSAVFGGGLAGRTISENSSWLPVEDMTRTLIEALPNIPFDHASVVVGCLAVTAVVSCKVWLGVKKMEKSSNFEVEREKARGVISGLEAAVKRSGYGDKALVEEFKKASDKFNSKFDEGKKLRPETLDEMRRMRASGAIESDIEEMISGSEDEYRWVKKIYSNLIENHCFEAPLAAKVAHDLIILHEGDLPLLQRRLHSAEVPQEMAMAHGFNPRSLVGAIKLKDRPSELLKLGKESLNATADLFATAANRIKLFYAESQSSTAEPGQERIFSSENGVSSHGGSVGMSSTFRVDGYREGFYSSPDIQAVEQAQIGVSVLDAEYNEGFDAGVIDRATVNGVKQFVSQMLDGGCITEFEHVSDFLTWLETINAYEQMDLDDDALASVPSEDLLAVAYEELFSEHQAEKELSKKQGSGPRM